jgi:hypothetical protein
MSRQTACLKSSKPVKAEDVYNHIKKTIPDAWNVIVTVSFNDRWIVDVEFISDADNIKQIDVFPPSLIYKSSL